MIRFICVSIVVIGSSDFIHSDLLVRMGHWKIFNTSAKDISSLRNIQAAFIRFILKITGSRLITVTRDMKMILADTAVLYISEITEVFFDILQTYVHCHRCHGYVCTKKEMESILPLISPMRSVNLHCLTTSMTVKHIKEGMKTNLLAIE